MTISYRLKIKELVFLLDIFGNPCSFSQGFGHIYIDKTEYLMIAEALNRKGFVTLSGKNVFVERGISVLLKNVFSADTVLADSRLERWIYCTDKMITVIRMSKNCPGEYLIEPYFNTSELFDDITEENRRSVSMDFYKGTEGTYDSKKVKELLEEKYEKFR